MITFKEFCAEALDKALPFQLSNQDHDYEFTAVFKAGKREIHFLAFNEDLMDEDDNRSWDISFGEAVRGPTDDEDHITYNKTDSGNEFQVFATLKAILEKFIKDKNPAQLRFTADKKDGNRARLYAKMFKRNMPSGWRLDQQDSDSGYVPQTEFAMVKEALDKPLPYKIVNKSPKFFNAKFTAGSRDIEFSADYTGANYWEISFSELLKKRPGPGARDTTKLSGSGNEFAVFATVKAIIEQFINEYHPSRLTIDSFKGEANRAKLYQRMIAKNLPNGWDMVRDDDHPLYTSFTLFKPR